MGLTGFDRVIEVRTDAGEYDTTLKGHRQLNGTQTPMLLAA